jgi:hypothetical protein
VKVRLRLERIWYSRRRMESTTLYWIEGDREELPIEGVWNPKAVGDSGAWEGDFSLSDALMLQMMFPNRVRAATLESL